MPGPEFWIAYLGGGTAGSMLASPLGIPRLFEYIKQNFAQSPSAFPGGFHEEFFAPFMKGFRQGERDKAFRDYFSEQSDTPAIDRSNS